MGRRVTETRLAGTRCDGTSGWRVRRRQPLAGSESGGSQEKENQGEKGPLSEALDRGVEPCRRSSCDEGRDGGKGDHAAQTGVPPVPVVECGDDRHRCPKPEGGNADGAMSEIRHGDVGIVRLRAAGVTHLDQPGSERRRCGDPSQPSQSRRRRRDDGLGGRQRDEARDHDGRGPLSTRREPADVVASV